MRKINERPGVAVCICGKNGTIIRHDPGLYMRTLREQYARATGKRRTERMTLTEVLIILFLFIPLAVLLLMFIIGVTYMQVKEECK